jgi:tRNA dimethylallyltransferase
MSKVVALVGATASGKTEAAHRAALAHGGTEIVALDAMSAYRGMDLGTAKPSRQQREEVRYHLVDVLDASEELSVQRFQALCAAAIEGITSRGSVALLVGGSGLYHRAVVDGLTIPPLDPDVRVELEAVAARPGGARSLHEELEACDPVAAARIDVRNVRRTVRALEVVRSTGRQFSSFGDGLSRYDDRGVLQLGIEFDAARTDAAIETRFGEWMQLGLLGELQGLLEAPGGLSRTARQAAGYRQLLEYLDGEVTLDVAVQRAITATRRLARRQWRWFRRDPRIAWLPNAGAAERALGEVLCRLEPVAQLEDS